MGDPQKQLYSDHIRLAQHIRRMAHAKQDADLLGVALEVLELGNNHLILSEELNRKETLMKRFAVLGLLVLLVLLMFGAVVVHAQDATPTPAPVVGSPIDVIPVDAAGTQLLAAVIALLGSTFTAPLTLLIVSWLKMLPFLDVIPARTLQFLVAVLLVGGTWITTHFGVSQQFNSFLNVLLVAGPVALQFVLTVVGSHAAYSYSAARDIALIGYQRPVK